MTEQKVTYSEERESSVEFAMRFGRLQKKACHVNGVRAGCFLTAVLLSALTLSFLYMQQQKRPEEMIQTSADVSEIGQRGKIALTFDDGPHPVYTRQLLDGLKERHIRATFFVMGENAELYPELIRQMQEDGHLIGNHTYSHMQLTKGKEESFKQELRITSSIIEKLTGEGTEFVRPPYGTWEKKFEQELNMFPVLWTIDTIEIKIGGNKSFSFAGFYSV